MSEEERRVPGHVAIIMDGNGRWAKRRGLPRNMGHARGAQVVEQILEDADDLGIRVLTVYAFSTENWTRPQSEVTALMNLLNRYLRSSVGKCMKNNVRVRIIGDRTKLSDELVESIRNMEEMTAGNTGILFQIAINYGGRDEIVRAVRAVAEDVRSGVLKPEEITEEAIAAHTDTAGEPDPDLLFRTCGDELISNFLLWQSAYTELYFTDLAWPDFTREELEKAIDAYNGRDRRFGGLKAK